MKYYAGLGSRSTPENILREMKTLAFDLAKKGVILRSGGADGADLAFEHGVDSYIYEVENRSGCARGLHRLKEIFLPWRGFNGSNSDLFNIPEEAYQIAKKIHPNYLALSEGGMKLHARNVLQILGGDLQTPVDFVLCWTKGGESVGGTRTAIELAIQNGIPVINLAKHKVNFATLSQLGS